MSTPDAEKAKRIRVHRDGFVMRATPTLNVPMPWKATFGDSGYSHYRTHADAVSEAFRVSSTEEDTDD